MARDNNPLASAGHSLPAGAARTWPLDLEGYCAWLNGREKRRGRWVIVDRDGDRRVDWQTDVATDDWLRERGLVPAIGSKA